MKACSMPMKEYNLFCGTFHLCRLFSIILMCADLLRKWTICDPVLTSFKVQLSKRNTWNFLDSAKHYSQIGTSEKIDCFVTVENSYCVLILLFNFKLKLDNKKVFQVNSLEQRRSIYYLTCVVCPMDFDSTVWWTVDSGNIQFSGK